MYSRITEKSIKLFLVEYLPDSQKTSPAPYVPVTPPSMTCSLPRRIYRGPGPSWVCSGVLKPTGNVTRRILTLTFLEGSSTACSKSTFCECETFPCACAARGSEHRHITTSRRQVTLTRETLPMF